MSTAKNSLVLMGVGDVGPIHEPVESFCDLARPILSTADIRFCQCERVYSDRGALQLHSGVHEPPLKAHMANVYKDFNVVSLAGNHGQDWGPDPLIDTMELLRGMGIKTVGGGRNLKEAREPAIVEKNGVRVAILAYCSILHEGFEAGPNKPGIAPLRAHTYYRPIEYQAGIPPKVVTVPWEEDLQAMLSDIRAVKADADVVVISLHWGIHFIPKMIADYQPVVASAAFKAGADLILGHHAHCPKAIGVHEGKVCFYSLSNFLMTSNLRQRLLAKEPGKTMIQALAAFSKKYGVAVKEDDPLPYGTDSARTLIAKAVLSKKGVDRVSFLPTLIDHQQRPEILRNGDPRFDDAVRFMEWVSEDLDHRFTVEGDEVVVTAK